MGGTTAYARRQPKLNLMCTDRDASVLNACAPCQLPGQGVLQRWAMQKYSQVIRMKPFLTHLLQSTSISATFPPFRVFRPVSKSLRRGQEVFGRKHHVLMCLERSQIPIHSTTTQHLVAFAHGFRSEVIARCVDQRQDSSLIRKYFAKSPTSQRWVK